MTPADAPVLRRSFLAALAAGLAPAACGRAPGLGGGVLNVGSQKGNTRSLMEASGSLAGASYAVKWSEFGAAAPLLEALGAGAVDLGGVGDAPFVFAYQAGAKIRAVMAYQAASSGASVAVLVPNLSKIRSPTDLKGRRVATGKGSVGHYLLLRLLQKASLPLDACEVIFLDPGDCKAALQRGAVDAWATWAPYVGLATLHDAQRVLADGRGLFTGYSFIAATDAAAASKRLLVSDFLGRLAGAYGWAQRNRTLYAAALSRETGMPLDVAVDTIARQDITPVAITPAVANAEAGAFDLFRRAGVATSAAPFDKAFDPSFSSAVASPART